MDAVKKILRDNPDVDVIIDMYTTEELYVSDRILNILGYSLDEVKGRSFFDGSPPEEIETQRKLFYDIVTSEKPKIVEGTRYTKSRKKVRIKANAFVKYYNNTPYGILKIISCKQT
ncbi:MAG: PAS domain-containing protein [Candidatus Diapherotrites archaeon]|nr:PAS domain-containing protein [Candidatus Diapherotrites archaeon]